MYKPIERVKITGLIDNPSSGIVKDREICLPGSGWASLTPVNRDRRLLHPKGMGEEEFKSWEGTIMVQDEREGVEKINIPTIHRKSWDNGPFFLYYHPDGWVIEEASGGANGCVTLRRLHADGVEYDGSFVVLYGYVTFSLKGCAYRIHGVVLDEEKYDVKIVR